MLSSEYFSKLNQILHEIEVKESSNIHTAAQKIFDTVQSGGIVYFFGCTHAGILTQEAFYRTGGLAVINPVFLPGTTCDVTPITLSSQIERIDQYGYIGAKEKGIKKGDLVFLHSVSGRNSVPVDFALYCQEAGADTVCITSLAYSISAASRHKSGKRLCEVCRLVIDDHCPVGDALVYAEQLGQSVAPASTAAGAAIVNAIVADCVEIFLKNNVVPPVFLSANIDGGDEHNRWILEQYQKQIKYML